MLINIIIVKTVYCGDWSIHFGIVANISGKVPAAKLLDLARSVTCPNVTTPRGQRKQQQKLNAGVESFFI